MKTGLLVALVLSLACITASLDPLADIPAANQIILTGNSGQFHSTNYPHSLYPNNEKKGWILVAQGKTADIEVRLKDFNLEPSKRCNEYDHVFFYTQTFGSNVWTQMNPLDGYCGIANVPAKFESCKKMLVKFVSDSTNPFKGFNATYSIRVTEDQPRIQCLGALGDLKCNRTVYTTETKAVQVACNATAIPPPTYDWWMQNSSDLNSYIKLPSTSTKYHATINGILTIKNIKMADAKKYRCVASNKLGSNQSDFTLIVQEKCSCPKEITTNSYEYAPYTRYIVGYEKNTNAPKYKGIFFVILDKMMKHCCGNCSGGHGPSTIKWEDISKTKQKTMMNMKTAIENGNYDLSFPAEGEKTSDYYSSTHLFIPVVDSPGIAFLVKKEGDSQATVIFESILNGWPVLVLTIVMAVLAGIIMWMLDTYWNEEQFPRSFTEGVVEGFWWAFVTMTTVGYGDIAPVGVPGRLFAIMWVLTGLIIISIFTGVITTALTVNTLSTDVKLYGTSVGAFHNTSELSYGIRKNANVTNYTSYEALSSALQSKTVKAILIDSFVAAQRPNLFGSDKARVNKIIKSTKAYGFVPGTALTADDKLIKCFRNYVEQSKQAISADVEANTNTLTEPSSSAAVENAAGLFDSRSDLFILAISVSCGLLVAFSILGLLFEYCYLKPKKIMLIAARNLEMVETPEIKEMAKRAQKMKEVLLHEIKVFHTRWSENVVLLRSRHKQVQKDFHKRGTAHEGKAIPSGKEAIELEETSPSPRASSNLAFVHEKGEM